MRILVTGGAGYIGSIMSRMLLDEGYSVVVVDNLSRGHRDAVDKRAEFVEADLKDKRLSLKFPKGLAFSHIDAVLHFAGVILMEESVRRPGFYFENNVCGSLSLLRFMLSAGIDKIVFSSSAGVYGSTDKIPIPETASKNPTNPYGESKLIVERILRWFWETKKISSISLRYYNPAGASLDGLLGERHKPESHIIPLALKAAQKTYEKLSKSDKSVSQSSSISDSQIIRNTDSTDTLRHRKINKLSYSEFSDNKFTLYGDDYPTKDRTCVRDYIHVVDLCRAHLSALKSLCQQPRCDVYNVGTGKGYSNKEVIDTVKKVTGVDFPVKIAGRRPGDAAELVANPGKIKRELGWEPEHSSLEEIVESAWKWERYMVT